MKFKRGFVREDGMVFWRYDRGLEYFVTQERYKKFVDDQNLSLKKWYKKNSEKHKTNRIKYHRLNPFVARKSHSKRRALLKDRLHPKHDFNIERVLTDQCKRLYNRLGVKFEIDHIVPLDKGGWHYHLNLQVIPAVWNRRKHTKDISVLPDCWISK